MPCSPHFGAEEFVGIQLATIGRPEQSSQRTTFHLLINPIILLTCDPAYTSAEKCETKAPRIRVSGSGMMDGNAPPLDENLDVAGLTHRATRAEGRHDGD
jgi:hypothetical protein